MKILYHEKPVPHITIENFYSNEQLSDIWKELDFLTNQNTLMNPSETGSFRIGSDGNPYHMNDKRNSGVFLDEFFARYRQSSHILTHSRKIFEVPFLEWAASQHFIFKYLLRSRKDSMLLSYYQDSDYYAPHEDVAVISACTWIFREPKKFNGGDFNFSDFEHKIQIKNNMTVIFPSIIQHSVDTISMKDHSDTPFSGNGRYVLSHFINI
jgi:hypothetical protein